jgi:hypothetical protein
MKNGKCTKNFPKPFKDATTMTEDSYTSYQCRRTDPVDIGGGRMVDNSWVVPYMPVLLMIFACHINGECVFSIKSVKYMHKYIYKGHDKVTMGFGQLQDEIQQYLDARYVSAPEAIWRLFKYDLHEEKPTVYGLQVHLPGEQSVVFNEDDAQEEVLANAEQRDTQLLAFFKACVLYPQARELLFHEMPGPFVWKTKKKEWHHRQQGAPAIGRMHFAHPASGERYYLRLLLTVVRGPMSFQHLRTVNGVEHDTFQLACAALGLLEDDGEWEQCLQEASVFASGRQLRSLYVTIIRDCQPLYPANLWEQFKVHLCDDLRHMLGQRNFPDPTQEQIWDFGLFLIQSLLLQSNKRLSDIAGMPVVQGNWEPFVERNRFIAEQLSYDVEAQARESTASLAAMNEEQRSAYDAVLASVHSDNRKLFFLQGPAGTGKTFTYKALCYALRAQSKIVLCVASSGIAALLLPGGRTSHSCFRIPIELSDISSCSISKQSELANLMCRVDLINWDEVPAQSRYGPEAVSRTLCDLRNDPRPFGGVTVLFGGDFQQTLPVIPRGSRPEIVSHALRSSPLWIKVTPLFLTTNMRLGQDPEDRRYAQWLQEMGHGLHTTPAGIINLPPHLRCPQNTVQSLINMLYPNIAEENSLTDAYFLERTILSARNDDVDELNAMLLNRMPGEKKLFQSSDSVEQKAGEDEIDEDAYTVETLNAINLAGLPLSKLELKVGCPLMILRNLDSPNGVCNGTRAVLTKAGIRVLEVRILGGDFAGQTALIPRMTLTPSDTPLPFTLRRRQFPVRLAFAMTINKSQGQSVKNVGLDLRTPVFTHGQLYIALSRVTSSQRIKAIFPEGTDGTDTMNVVYPEVLLDPPEVCA